MTLKETRYEGIYRIDGKIATKNLIKGFRSHGEKILSEGGEEYRAFSPNRSKLAAAIKKEIKEIPIKKGIKILYLGAAQGYTPSYVSDLVGKRGIIYSVEFSERAMRDLLNVCEKRKNIIPILEDARKPKQYLWIDRVEVLYGDIAQPDATEVAMRNADHFLKEGGSLLLAVKSRSIDVTKAPEKIYREELKKLKENGFEIIDWKKLDPLEKDHAFIVAKKCK